MEFLIKDFLQGDKVKSLMLNEFWRITADP